MEFKLTDGVLNIFFSGRIDSSNADDVGAEIEKIKAGCSYDNIIIDAEDLEYISSAGLRQVLKLRRKVPGLEIINADSEVYDIFEMTGFTEMIPVHKAYRKISIDGCPIIGKGAKGTVYRWQPDTIVKVYNDPDSLPAIHQERKLARMAFVLGVPTAISYDVVKVGDKYGSVFELLDAQSFSAVIANDSSRLEECAEIFARVLREIHGTEVKAGSMPDAKVKFSKNARNVSAYLSTEANDKIEALLDDVPELYHMLHCDYHTNNIMLQNGEALIIDMDTLSYGHPVFELGNIYITFVGFGEVRPSVVEEFLGFSYDLTVRFWNRFLHYYLCSDDEEFVKAVEDKSKLLAYLRFLNHNVRRGITDGEENELCRRNIEELTKRVNSLTW